VRVKNKHDGYAPPWRPALTPPSWIDLRDQKFESGFLQRRVTRNAPLALAYSQQEAVRVALVSKLLAITGGPPALVHSRFLAFAVPRSSGKVRGEIQSLCCLPLDKSSEHWDLREIAPYVIQDYPGLCSIAREAQHRSSLAGTKAKCRLM
jgi:hypothetical protein